MDPQSLLLTTAEISVAFAGFASLVGVLLQRRDFDFRTHAVDPLRVMLDYSLIALFSCLVPFLPMIAGASPVETWRYSSAAWVVGTATYVALNRPWLRELRQKKLYAPVAAWIVYGLDIASVILLIANAAGVFWEPSFLPYYAVLLWFLAGAAIGFVKVVSLLWSEPDP